MPSLETSSQTCSEVCFLSDSGCYQHEPSPWFIVLPPAEMRGCHNYTWLCGAGVLTQSFVMLGRSSTELHKPVSLALSMLIHLHDVSSYLNSLLSWTWHHVIMWLLGNSCHVHNLVMCVFATVDILLPSVVVCNGMSVVWIYVTNCVCWFYNPLNVFLYFYYFIYIFSYRATFSTNKENLTRSAYFISLIVFSNCAGLTAQALRWSLLDTVHTPLFHILTWEV